MRSTSSLILVLAAACGRVGNYDVTVRGAGDAIVADWVEIGGSASGGGVTQHGDLALCDRVAIDGQGRIYVAWADASSGAGQVYLRRYDGGAWTSLAGSADGAGVSVTGGVTQDNTMTCPSSLVFDASDVPYIAWQHATGTLQSIYMRYLDSGAWRELGGSGSGTGLTGAFDGWWPSMIVDATGPVLAYETQTNVVVRRWNGAWAGVGSAGAPPGLPGVPNESHLVSLKLDGQGRLLAVWVQAATTDYEIRVARFDGGAWAPLGGVVGHSNTPYEAPAIVTHGDDVFVAWSEDDDVSSHIHMAQLVSGDWAMLPDPTQSGFTIAMAIDGVGRPLLVWEQQDSMGLNIHGARWSGSAWQSIDGAEGGISRQSLLAETPSIAVGNDGTIVVSWLQDLGGGLGEVYAKALTLE